jgi:hypothetical protein
MWLSHAISFMARADAAVPAGLDQELLAPAMSIAWRRRLGPPPPLLPPPLLPPSEDPTAPCTVATLRETGWVGQLDATCDDPCEGSNAEGSMGGRAVCGRGGVPAYRVPPLPPPLSLPLPEKQIKTHAGDVPSSSALRAYQGSTAGSCIVTRKRTSLWFCPMSSSALWSTAKP